MVVGTVLDMLRGEAAALVNSAKAELLVHSAQLNAMRLRQLVEDWRIRQMIRAYRQPSSRHAYNPEQPRVPAGVFGGGRWTIGAGMVRPYAPDASNVGTVQVAGGGHHYVPNGVYGNYPFAPETRKVFDEARTGPLASQRHNFGDGHAGYNAAVRQELDRFLAVRNITPEQMTPDQARTFTQQVLNSREPAIREFNLRIWRRELRFWMLRAPRSD